MATAEDWRGTPIVHGAKVLVHAVTSNRPYRNGPTRGIGFVESVTSGAGYGDGMRVNVKLVEKSNATLSSVMRACVQPANLTVLTPEMFYGVV